MDHRFESLEEASTRILSETIWRTFDFELLYEDSKHKSEICRAAYRPTSNECRFSKKCDFAHAIKELKPRVFDFTNFKKQRCRGFENNGCSYATRCLYLHDEKIYQLNDGITLLFSQTEKKFRMIRDQGNGTVCVFTLDYDRSPRDGEGMKVLKTLRNYVDGKFEDICKDSNGKVKLKKISKPKPAKRVVRAVPVEPSIDTSETEYKTEEREAPVQQVKNTCIIASIPAHNVQPVPCSSTDDKPQNPSPKPVPHVEACRLPQPTQQVLYQSASTFTAPAPHPQPFVYQPANPYLPSYQGYLQQQQFYQTISATYPSAAKYPNATNFPPAYLEMSPSPRPVYFVANPYPCYRPTYPIQSITTSRTKAANFETFFPDGCGVKLPPSPCLSSCKTQETNV